jgi:hypothetical protein
MTTFSKKILSAALIVSLSFINSAHVFADQEATTTAPVIATSTAPVATSTPLVFSIATSTPVVDSVIASSTNVATTTNLATTTASSGNNVASSTATTTIITGPTIATTNITNVVNVNIFNSDVLFTFLNRLSSADQNADLGAVLSGATSGAGCIDCNFATTSLQSSSNIIPNIITDTKNNGVISNTTIVRADTGNNTASSSQNSTIATGDAFANANVANVVNANFVNSHYVMVVLNNFGGLSNDIVLPSASFFDNVLTNTQTSNSTAQTITTNATNTAAVTNTISTTADSGNNISTSTNASLIQTGDTHAGSNVINNINQNILGGTSVALMFRVYGNWSGKAFNVPKNIMWHNTPVGITFIGNSDTASSTSNNNNSITASSENTATINNTVAVSANSGNNQTSGNSATISTGNAYANANVVNLVNTNVVGRNWINAIINVFGDWTGNISFGQPNLWVGTRADVGNANGGSLVTYHYTIKNNGNAPAHDVHLAHAFNLPYISFPNNENNWTIGTVAPGEIKEVSYTARIADENNLPYGNTPVINTITLSATETDADLKDNTDSLTTVVSRAVPYVYGNYEPVLHGVAAHFTITKTNNATSALAASSTVDYTISIKNVGGAASHAILDDNIKSQTGDIIHSEEWDLGPVKSQEEITVTYTALFNASTTPGMYTNTAQVTSVDKTFEDSGIASSTITITSSNNAHNTLDAFHKGKVLSVFYSNKHIRHRSFVSLSHSNVATTTATTTLMLASLDDLKGIKKIHTSQLSNALSALGNQSWYWWGLIIVGGAYLATRSRNPWGV